MLVVFQTEQKLHGRSGLVTYTVLSCVGCEQGALNTSPFVWHLTLVKSVFPPTVCLEFLLSDKNMFTLV